MSEFRPTKQESLMKELAVQQESAARTRERQERLDSAAESTGSIALLATAEIHGHIVDFRDSRVQSRQLEIGSQGAFDRAASSVPESGDEVVRINLSI